MTAPAEFRKATFRARKALNVAFLNRPDRTSAIARSTT